MTPISFNPKTADGEGFIEFENGSQVWFELKTLKVVYIFKPNHVRVNIFDMPLRYGVHSCKNKVIIADGIVLCEHCNEVIEV